MKKILLIIIFVFLTTGCYDYIELNQLSIITGISIDYEDNEYRVGFEILNDQKESKDSSKKSAFIVEGKSKTLSDAFNDVSIKVPKKPYFSHLKSLILSQSIAQYHLEDITDYFLRTPDIRNEFDTVIAYNINALDLLKSANKDNPVVSDNIETMLINNKYHENNAVSHQFEESVKDTLSFGKDPNFTLVGLDNNKNLIVLGIGVFHKYNLTGYLLEEDAITFNVLKSNTINSYYIIPCNNDYVTLSIYNSDVEFNVTETLVQVKAKLKGNIIENNCNLDLKKNKTYDELNNKYADIFEEKINVFLEKLKDLNTDPYGISNKYYIKTRKKNSNIFKYLDYKVIVDFSLNKKGLIFEVENDK